MDYASTPSQDPALEALRDDILESGHGEQLDNEKRGCGHLSHNACYVRSDVHALSSDEGSVPRFVELDDPQEYRETPSRGSIIPGYEEFPGVEYSLAYQMSGGTTTPAGAIDSHIDRLRRMPLDGEHYGEQTPAHAHDLLMSVGASHWPTPEEYIEECRERGLNLKIPAGKNNSPPTINPMRTRCWIVHPNGIREGRAALIGWAVLTRAVFTTGEEATAEEPDVPTYAAEWAETGTVSLATPGPTIDPDVDGELTDLSTFDDGGSAGDSPEQVEADVDAEAEAGAEN